MDSGAFKISDPSSPWLTPMGPLLLRGGLRGMISQYSDGTTNTLTPKRVPTRKKTEFTYVGFNVV